jgi:hypothetical protein
MDRRCNHASGSRILADLGVTGLKGMPFEQLFNETVRLSMEGLSAEFGKVLAYLPTETDLSCAPGLVGKKGWWIKRPLAQTSHLRRALHCAPASP